MAARTRTTSVHRPTNGVDQTPLLAEPGLLRTIQRRGVLKGSLSLGAVTMLSGCDISDTAAVHSVLKAVSGWNDRVQAWLFDPTQLAPTFTDAQVRRPPRYNAYYPISQVKPVDITTWKLELGGRIRDKRPWTIDQIRALPEVTQITRHVCVEGWDYIGKWTGVPLRLFLEHVGADLDAKYVAFHCNDTPGVFGSIDMPSALHPQTQLSTKYANAVLDDPYGFPLRLRCATKLGFKCPKWIRAIEVTNDYPGGYWEDGSYNWFSGI